MPATPVEFALGATLAGDGFVTVPLVLIAYARPLGLSLSDLLVIAVLLWHQRERGGWVYPGQKRLAELTGLGTRTIQRSLDRLVGCGLIERERRSDGGGRGGVPNRYRLEPLLTRLDALTKTPTGDVLVKGTKAPTGDALVQYRPTRQIDATNTPNHTTKAPTGDVVIEGREGTDSPNTTLTDERTSTEPWTATASKQTAIERPSGPNHANQPPDGTSSRLLDGDGAEEEKGKREGPQSGYWRDKMLRFEREREAARTQDGEQ